MGSNAAVEGVSGALGGVVAILATYPLMTIQTVQATRRQAKEADAAFTIPVQKSGGTFSDLAEVISSSGWRGLFKGLQPSLLGTIVSQGVYFYLYSLLRQAAVRRQQLQGRGMNGDIGPGLSLIVAFLAGCGNVLLTNPIWVVATRMQAHQKKDQVSGPGPLAVAKEIVDESGVRGLWKGVLPSLVMVANPSLNYMLYESLSARLASWRRSSTASAKIGPASAVDVFAISAVAKLGATVLTYPLQLIKARLQSAGKHTHSDRRYTGTLDAVLRIWQNEGFLGFFRGMHTKIVQSILAAALLMAIKEKLTQAALLLLAPEATLQPKITLLVNKNQ